VYLIPLINTSVNLFLKRKKIKARGNKWQVNYVLSPN